LTEEAHDPTGSAGAGRPAITWLGHATTLIELDSVRLVTDPVLGGRIGPLVRIAAAPPPDALERIDGVLLSHLHADHADLPSLRELGHVPVLAPRPAGGWLHDSGIPEVRELTPGESTHIGELKVEATPATHDSRRRPLGAQADPIGFLVCGSISVYFAGDTDLFSDMADLRGRVDVALLPVWGWGKRLGPGHLDPERAARAAAMIEPRLAIPIHWGTFALGWPARRSADPWRPAREFAALARRHAPGVEVHLLAPGETVRL
jgi:L-ascorbate metabolism protein UlaG (beta-lactamase superfamily)